MREILFKAKAINRKDYYRSNYKDGDWVYGLITKQYNARYDFPATMTNENGISGIEVDYKTLSQYTGLKDKNGKMIFENDILDYWENGKENIKQRLKVFYENGQFVVDHYAINLLNSRNMSSEIIGNIFDNPELLEKGGAS